MSSVPQSWPAVVLLQPADDGVDAPLAELNAELARRIVSEFADDVLHLIVVDGDPPPETSGRGQPTVRYVTAPPEPTKACQAIQAAVAANALPFAYTVLDVSARSPGLQNLLVDWLGTHALPKGLHRRLIRLRRTPPPFVHTLSEIDAVGWSVLATVFLEPDAGTRRGPGFVNTLKERFGRRLGWNPPISGATSPNPLPGVRHDLLPEEVRVTRLWGPPPPDRDASWARFVRAVTRRRVGVALGGSGAWGFSHVALLQQLGVSGVPVDMLASASSGSVIAGYYAALGPPGLELVLQRGWRLDAAVVGSIFDMGVLEFVIGLDTGFPALDQLELMFYPVTTNLTTMTSDRVVNASVPWGVRASSTAPGLFAATATGDAVFVDGAVADNVPASLVAWLGASLVVASNALPAPADIPRPCDATLTLSPFFRIRELGASLSLMFHDVGDWESVDFITYDPPQTSYPLARTFMFNAAKQVYRQTLEQSEFQLAIRRARAAWEQLSRARTGL